MAVKPNGISSPLAGFGNPYQPSLKIESPNGKAIRGLFHFSAYVHKWPTL
jgi:hypothetical protein